MWRRGLMLGLLMIGGLAQGKVEIEGLDKAQAGNVRAWLSIAELPEDADARTVQHRHRRAPGEIRKALQALGYYSPQIRGDLQREETGWLAVYRIDSGPRTRIESVDIQIEGESTIQTDQFGGQALVGRGLHHDDYRALKTRILDLAFDAGYLNASFSRSVLRVDPDQARADLEFVLNTGPRFRFGDIRIEQDILYERVIQRYVDIGPQDVFNADRLLALRLRLSDLDYFEDLEVITEAVDDDGDPRVDVLIKASPRPPQRYQVGLGYGTDTGPRLSVSSEFRRLNKRGHRLRSDLRVSEVQNQLSAQYLIPSGSDIGSNWALQTRYTDESFVDSESESYLFGVARNRIEGPRIWQAYLNYELEQFRVGAQRRDTELTIPGLSVTWRKADDTLNPRRGFKLFADVHGAHQDMVSSASFLQVLVQGRLILPLSSRSRLLLRGQSGTSFVGAVSELPVSQRFYSGGDQSVRGYAYQSLGPRDEDGAVIGGKYLSVASVELDCLCFGDYGLAAFYDYGGASDNPGGDRVRGLGAGFRWRTAIGMLRIDLAHPLDDPDGGVRLHIGIGAEL